MNLKSFSFFLLLVISLPLQAFAGQNGFHPPQTDAEKELDVILKYYGSNSLSLENILTRTLSNSLLEKRLSKGLKNSLAQAEEEQVQKECGGKYIEGELCGLGFNPVTCTQDYNDSYLYKNIKATNSESIIQYTWPQIDNIEMPTATYKLIKDEKGWLLDGIICGHGQKFNLDNSGK